jgi:hypothetical protein
MHTFCQVIQRSALRAEAIKQVLGFGGREHVRRALFQKRVQRVASPRYLDRHRVEYVAVVALQHHRLVEAVNLGRYSLLPLSLPCAAHVSSVVAEPGARRELRDKSCAAPSA